MKLSQFSLNKSTLQLDDRLVAELIRRMALMLEGMVPSALIFPIAMVTIMWGHVSHTQLLIWAVFEMGCSFDRYQLARRYIRLNPPIDQARRWARRLTINVLCGGVIWGIGGILFFVDGSLPYQVLLITIILGIGGGSITVFFMSFWPPTLYAFATPAIGLTAIRIAMEGSVPYQILSGFMVFYLLMLYQMVNEANRITVDAIKLRFENLDLIEQLKGQKEIAEKANVAKSKFLAAASHDLRQPLHALGLFASALNERIKFPDVRRLVDNINLSVAALEELFNALLDISRLDAGIISPKFQHFRIQGLMDRLDAEFTDQARNKGLNIQFEGTDVPVYSDPVLIETMLRNLIGNALRFTEHGKVKVAWLVEADQVWIEVHDTGIGIPIEDQ